MRASLGLSMRRVGLAALLVSTSTTAALAQLPNASTAAFGMAGNFTAMARGYEAIAWNPANLAMPGRPFFSIGLGIFGGSAGLDPLDVKTLNSFSGKVVDSVTRVDWIDQARLSGGQRVRIDGGVTPIALSVGPVGLQLGASVYSNVALSPDAWEAALFGNAGANGNQPKTLDFTGTSVRIGAVTAGGVSFALPIPINLTSGLLSNEHAAVGLTGKYVLGNFLAIAQDNGSIFGGDELRVRFPVIKPDSTYRETSVLGSGMGLDMALAWSGGPWRVGVLAENVFNTFKWDSTLFSYDPGIGSFTVDSADFPAFENATAQEFGTAPAALRKLVTGQRFKPAIAVGMAFNLMPKLTLTADMKTHIGAGDEAIIVGPRSRFGVGAEWRVVPFAPLRGGVASVTDGWQVGVGAGLRLLGYELGVSTSIRRRGAATESGLMIGLVGIGR